MLLWFEKTDGTEVWINGWHVSAVVPDAPNGNTDGCTVYTVPNGATYQLRENAKDVVEALNRGLHASNKADD